MVGKPALLRAQRSQRGFGHLIRMPTGGLPDEVFRARPIGRSRPGRPRTCFLLAGLGMPRNPPEELDKVAGDWEVWDSLLRLLPSRPDPR